MFPTLELAVTIQGEHPVDFGTNPGSTIRGGLYQALQVMYDTQVTPEGFHDLATNPVAWLLRMVDEGRIGGQDTPRPFAIRVPTSNNQSQNQFGIRLFGEAINVVPIICSALPSMGTIGIGIYRARFTVASIHIVHPLTKHHLLYVDQTGQVINPLPDALKWNDYLDASQWFTNQPLTVEFLTPTTIKFQKKIQSHASFRVWFQRLLERINDIGMLYGHMEEKLPFQSLLESADTVETLEDKRFMKKMRSGSRKTNSIKATSGFMGTITYKTIPDCLIPYLLFGQVIHVGKNAVKGNGWYQLKASL